MSYWSGSEIASPSRRSLEAHHRDFLENSSQHGITIESFTASDGTPCLIVAPDATGKLGHRGEILRSQLAAKGRSLRPVGEIIGTLVLTHGRKGRKEDYLPIADRLCAAGFRCVIPDLPGHGDHPENVATYGVREAELPYLVLSEAALHQGFNPAPAGLLGISMGGSVAIHAATRDDAPWRALVVVSSFDSLDHVIHNQSARYAGTVIGTPFAHAARRVYRWKTGISLEDIQPHRHAAVIRIPTLIAHGSIDRVIAPSSGRNLYNALPSPTTKKWVEVPRADHDNVLITEFPIYAEIADWMLRHVP